jgi:hypothetical protein
MAKNPQEAFLELLIAAMQDAAVNKKLTQLQTQLDPTETGRGPLKRIRIIVVPDELDFSWPSHAPLGSNPTPAS